MTPDPSPGDPLPQPVHSRAWWIVRALEVRLRFFALIGLAAAVIAGWPWMRGLWERVAPGHSHAHSAAVSADSEFFCPMDPGVVSTWPAICPICNMDLVPRKKTDAVILPEGVVARMQFSPYRVQLAGIRTVPVERRTLDYELAFHGVWQVEAAAELPTQDRQTTSDSANAEHLGYLDVAVAPGDAEFFQRQRPASLRMSAGLRTSDAEPEDLPAVAAPREQRGDSKATRLRIVLRDGPLPRSLNPGTAVTAIVRVPAAEVLAGSQSPSDDADPGILVVPASSVLERDGERIVYVETMSGMFDGVPVRLGRRAGNFYPVLAGVTPGQRVAAMGSFLIDAESRLNPNVAAQYFGANAQEAGRRGPPPLPERSTARKRSLSDEEQELAKRQRICPVTGLPLGSMGEPIAFAVKGRKVFLCCRGCEKAIAADPDKYLPRLEAPAQEK